jgi:hypothetical protein
MYIIVTISTPKKSVDIQTDSLQKIEAVLALLSESAGIFADNSEYLRSAMQNRVVSAKNTFEDENIQTGDELVVV